MKVFVLLLVWLVVVTSDFLGLVLVCLYSWASGVTLTFVGLVLAFAGRTR